MEWWQVLLMFVAALAVGVLIGALVHYLPRQLAIGVLIGALVHYLPRQLARRREMASMTREQEIDESVIESVIEPVIEGPVVEEPVAEVPVAEEPVAEESAIKEPATKKQVEVALPELLEEVVNNHRIAATPWAGKLLPFQTQTWETLQDNVNNVPANIHDALAQIYIDIRLANSIVRLATDFNRRSGSLDESYKKLCTGIAGKINKIKPQIK